jgi:hypothetical protein
MACPLDIHNRMQPRNRLFRVFEAKGAFGRTPNRQAGSIDRSTLGRRRPTFCSSFDVDDVGHSLSSNRR